MYSEEGREDSEEIVQAAMENISDDSIVVDAVEK